MAVAAATRAISQDGEVDVQFVSERPAVTGKTVRLTKPSVALPFEEVCQARGEADAVALRFRHHDPSLHQAYAPDSQLARVSFNAFEQARCEALGTRRMIGVKQNLDVVLEKILRHQRLSSSCRSRKRTFT